ncbi:MAG: glycoside hydrolase family 5 protein [Anaerolineae bacterium]
MYIRSGLLYLFVLALLFGCSNGARAGPLDAASQAAWLGRGVNLGNALEAPKEGEWGMVLERAFFELIKEAGFDTVRVPIRWSAHAADAAPYTIDPAFFERVDWVIAQALKQDLNVVINMHHYDEIFQSPKDHEDRFIAMWEQIATRYADQPSAVYFELLNEPHDKLDARAWNALLAKAIETVRQIDDDHTLIVGGPDWNSITGLRYLELPADSENIIATYHYYEPFLFTHQGAEWVGPEIGTTGVTWPGPPEVKITPVPAAQEVDWVRMWFARYNDDASSANPASPDEIERAFDQAVAWRDRTGVPLWLGEFGAYSTADMASRVRWTSTVRQAAEDRGISWAYWEFGAGFGVYDREAAAWRTPLLQALVPDGEE